MSIGMNEISIVQLTTLSTDDVSRLVALSEEENFRFVRRLAEEWASGQNRFDKPGEILLGAYLAKSLIGVCGVNQDPYVNQAGVGRLRHLYVDPVLRLNGVGSALVLGCLRNVVGSFHKIRLRTPDGKAHALYKLLGFNEINLSTASHEYCFR